MKTVDHIEARTYHGRKGAVKNAFSYSVDYVLVDAEAEVRAPWPFTRNRPGMVALHDVDHGGLPKAGTGAAWVRDVLRTHGLPNDGRIELLAQPKVLGHLFNAVSFWLCYDATGALRVVIAEVANTFGDRHSYLCHHDDHRAISAKDTLHASKMMHVSPFQPLEGGYAFNYDITDEKISIRIDYTETADPSGGGLIATLTGKRQPLTTRSMLRMLVRRPLGSRRVLTLVHWQAVKLWFKGAKFRSQPEPPETEISR